jgi:hypothetical protein
MKKINLFSDLIFISNNSKLAMKLLPVCKEKLKNCFYDSHFYENQLTTYAQKNEDLKNFKNWKEIVFKELETYILKEVDNYMDLNNINKKHCNPKINSMWISEMFEYGHLQPHQHLGDKDFISGNFFVFAGSGSSSLSFLRHFYEKDSWKEIPVNKFDEYNITEFHCEAETGKLILFKSTMLHYVKLNKSKSRITVSFNISL